MKKILIIICLLSSIPSTRAQPNLQLDTIYANDKKNVALFFPEPIRQGITGSENFLFTFNREKEQHFGLLQAKPGDESNLLVIGNSGSIFSYIIKYSMQLTTLNHFIAKAKRIGTENPLSEITAKGITKEESDTGTIGYYEQFCFNLINRKQGIRKLKKQAQGVTLRIDNIVFDKEELYFVIQIENNSSLDYDFNFLNLSVQTRKKGKKKSMQSLYKEPVFKYNLPLKIKKKQAKKLIYVLPKFSISPERLVNLELNEKKGERNLKLKVSSKYINNPN